MVKEWDFEAGKKFKNSKITNIVLCLMAIIGRFQCDPWCLPTQNWLKNATNDISILEFHKVTRHYVKDTGKNESKFQNTALLMVAVQIWIDFYTLTG